MTAQRRVGLALVVGMMLVSMVVQAAPAKYYKYWVGKSLVCAQVPPYAGAVPFDGPYNNGGCRP